MCSKENFVKLCVLRACFVLLATLIGKLVQKISRKAQSAQSKGAKNFVYFITIAHGLCDLKLAKVLRASTCPLITNGKLCFYKIYFVNDSSCCY